MRPTQRSAPGLRAHRAKYNIDTEAVRALTIALRALDKHDDAVNLAMLDSRENDDPSEFLSLACVRGGLRLLVHGPTGEFK